MGYGEFGGGGSIEWKIKHGGNTEEYNGKDPKPKKSEDGQFTILIKAAKKQEEADSRTTIELDGTVRVSCPIDHANKKQIQIYWAP